MIKGSRKEMIVVRTGGSRFFDEAYFVLRKDIPAGSGEKNDMISEADRIIRESETVRTGKKRKTVRRVALFLAGAAVGTVITLLLCWLI